MEYSGAGGKLIHEKNQKQKISWHWPMKKVVTRDKQSLALVWDHSNQRLFAIWT
jgi:hypothetical protein